MSHLKDTWVDGEAFHAEDLNEVARVVNEKADTEHTHKMSTLDNDCNYAKVVKLTQEEYDELVDEGTVDEGTIYAITAATPTVVTVTFENYDGTILQEDDIIPGDTPVFTGDTPTRDDDYDEELNIGTGYTFEGWNPVVGPVTADTVYTAVYSEWRYRKEFVHRFNRLRSESDFNPEHQYVLCASPDDFVDHSISMWISAGYSGGTQQIYNYVNTTLHDVEDGWDSVDSFDADSETMEKITAFIELTPEEEGSIRLIWYNNEEGQYLYLGTNASSNKFVSSNMSVDTDQYRWVLDYDENDEFLDIRGLGRDGSTVRFNPSSPRFSVYTSTGFPIAYLFSYEPIEEKIPILEDELVLSTRNKHEYHPYTSDSQKFIVTEEENNTPQDQTR